MSGNWGRGLFLLKVVGALVEVCEGGGEGEGGGWRERGRYLFGFLQR